MLAPLAASDELKLYGAHRVATLPVTAATLALRFGLPLARDPDFLPGLGTFDVITCELDDAVPFTVATGDTTHDGSPQTTAAVFAHSRAHVPAIARALGVDERDIVIIAADPPKPWLVVRLDDNGNRYVLNRCELESQATRAAELWTRRIGAHHQAVVVERVAAP